MFFSFFSFLLLLQIVVSLTLSISVSVLPIYIVDYITKDLACNFCDTSLIICVPQPVQQRMIVYVFFNVKRYLVKQLEALVAFHLSGSFSCRLTLISSLQGDVGHPGVTGDPGPKGEKVNTQH